MNTEKRMPPRPLIVQKYGGSSLATPAQIQAVAARIAKLYDTGHSLIIVVSAMGKTTDQLVELAYQISPTPNRRELDMLLTTGERISMALMSMALNDKKCPAISFTGSQAGVFTDDLHSNARIFDIKPTRIESELAQRRIVILAGFQGVSPKTKEVTTLGRGGSDTTAVAMASYFKAKCCEILKDVDGVHSADPNAVESTTHIPHLNYHELLDMTFWGAKVLHYRSVELAAVTQTPLLITMAHQEGAYTMIDGESTSYEQARILSVNSHKDVIQLRVKALSIAEAFKYFNNTLNQARLPLPQVLDTELETSLSACRFLITAPQETLAAVRKLVSQDALLEIDPNTLSSVTATCQGAYASPLASEIAAALASSSISIKKMVFGAMSLSVILDAKDREPAIQLIHDLRLS